MNPKGNLDKKYGLLQLQQFLILFVVGLFEFSLLPMFAALKFNFFNTFILL